MKERLALAALLLGGAVVFGTGITWGLPSRAVDPFLFGDREPWSGQTIRELAGPRPETATRGADVDATPRLGPTASAIVNSTDAQRAEIILRYRLYTYQPDEMITLMSLAGMRPREGALDPKLYQYGGFWIYSVGALLRAAAMLRLIHLEHGLTYYLDHPGEFGRFYVVARAYSAAWGLLGGLAVFWLTRRLAQPSAHRGSAAGGGVGTTASILVSFARGQSVGGDAPPQKGDGRVPACAATAAYLTLPVVINMAHEAKPHLAGAALMLLAVLAALRHVATGRRRWWIAAGFLCGLAFGTVLSALPVFVVLPIMVVLRPGGWTHRAAVLAGSVLVGIATYAFTNPYVLINWFANPAVLESNLKNSLAMYAVGGWADGVRNAAYLAGEAATPVIAVLGVLVPMLLLVLRWDELRGGLSAAPRDPRVCAALLLAAPALLVLIQFCLLAAGKPSEYGRFLVFPATALTIGAVASLQAIRPAGARRWQAVVVLASLTFGSRYVYAFYRDTTPRNSRWEAAAVIRDRGELTLLAPRDPAPYNMPPVNLFTRSIVVEPAITAPGGGQLLVLPADDPGQLRLPPEVKMIWPARRRRPLGEPAISWADKPILIVAPG